MNDRNLQLRYLYFALTLLLTACASVPEEPLRGVTSLTTHTTQSDQEYSLAYMPDAGKVSLHFAWPNDFPYASGMPVVSALGVEMMSSGGAGVRSARKIKQDMTALGSGASLVATPDHIYGTFSSSPETLDETLSIIKDVITKPIFDDVRFEVVKEAKQKRVVAQQTKPSSRLWSAARRALLGDTALTDYWNNTPVDPIITSISLKDLKRWHAETFTRQDVTVAVAGSITAEDAAAAIDNLLLELPAGRSIGPLTDQSLNSGKSILLHDETVPNTLIAAIGVLPASREGGEIADIVAVSALGKGKESRLLAAGEKVLSDTDELNASVANFSRAIRVFGINVKVSNDAASEAFGLVEDVYTEFRRGNLDDQEVLRGAVPFANSLQSNDKNPDLLAYGLGQLLLDELPSELLLTVTQDSVALKAEGINQRIVERYPLWKDMIKVIVSRDAKVVEVDCVVESIEEISGC